MSKEWGIPGDSKTKYCFQMMHFREANFSKETIFKSCKKFHFIWN